MCVWVCILASNSVSIVPHAFILTSINVVAYLCLLEDLGWWHLVILGLHVCFISISACVLAELSRSSCWQKMQMTGLRS